MKELQTELGQLCAVDAMIYQPLYEMTQVIIILCHIWLVLEVELMIMINGNAANM